MGETRHPPGQRSCHQCLSVEVPGARVSSDGGWGAFATSMNRGGRTTRERQAISTRGDRHAINRAKGAAQDVKRRDTDDGEGDMLGSR
jgi:hypothetical protein